MSKAVAIAAVQENPFALAIQSAVNMVELLADILYGTPQRSKLTCAMAFALAMLGASLNAHPLHILQACAI